MSNKIKMQKELPTIPGHEWRFWRSCLSGLVTKEGNKAWQSSVLQYDIERVVHKRSPNTFKMRLSYRSKKEKYKRTYKDYNYSTLEACRDELVRKLTLIRLGIDDD